MVDPCADLRSGVVSAFWNKSAEIRQQAQKQHEPYSQAVSDAMKAHEPYSQAVSDAMKAHEPYSQAVSDAIKAHEPVSEAARATCEGDYGSKACQEAQRYSSQQWDQTVVKAQREASQQWDQTVVKAQREASQQWDQTVVKAQREASQQWDQTVVKAQREADRNYKQVVQPANEKNRNLNRVANRVRDMDCNEVYETGKTIEDKYYPDIQAQPKRMMFPQSPALRADDSQDQISYPPTPEDESPVGLEDDWEDDITDELEDDITEDDWEDDIEDEWEDVITEDDWEDDITEDDWEDDITEDDLEDDTKEEEGRVDREERAERVKAWKEAARFERENTLLSLDEIVKEEEKRYASGYYRETSKEEYKKSREEYQQKYYARLRLDLEAEPNKRIDHANDGSSYVEMLPDGTIHMVETTDLGEESKLRREEWAYTDGKMLSLSHTHEDNAIAGERGNWSSHYENLSIQFQEDPLLVHLYERTDSLLSETHGMPLPEHVETSMLDDKGYQDISEAIKEGYRYGPWTVE